MLCVIFVLHEAELYDADNHNGKTYISPPFPLSPTEGVMFF